MLSPSSDPCHFNRLAVIVLEGVLFHRAPAEFLSKSLNVSIARAFKVVSCSTASIRKARQPSALIDNQLQG
jgi:hypothetical protein